MLLVATAAYKPKSDLLHTSGEVYADTLELNRKLLVFFEPDRHPTTASMMFLLDTINTASGRPITIAFVRDLEDCERQLRVYDRFGLQCPDDAELLPLAEAYVDGEAVKTVTEIDDVENATSWLDSLFKL